MTQYEMYEQSFKRPHNFFQLDSFARFEINKKLGLLYWDGGNLNKEQLVRFENHYLL